MSYFTEMNDLDGKVSASTRNNFRILRQKKGLNGEKDDDASVVHDHPWGIQLSASADMRGGYVLPGGIVIFDDVTHGYDFDSGPSCDAD